MTLFIGDVHGKFKQYKRIIRDKRDTIQVGDMGIGFISPITHRYMQNPPHDMMVSGNHRFIRGNHDNPEVCHRHSQFIHDGTIEGEAMFVGGALSIDRAFRQAEYTWWEDEELSYAALWAIQEVYGDHKPKVMVTHEAPERLVPHLLWRYKGEFPSRTRQAFDNMLDMHKPELWIFGHWHTSMDIFLDGTQFVCLGELEAREFDVGLDTGERHVIPIDGLDYWHDDGGREGPGDADGDVRADRV